MKKKSWYVTIPGHLPFPMIPLGAAMSYAEALACARSIWPMAQVG